MLGLISRIFLVLVAQQRHGTGLLCVNSMVARRGTNKTVGALANNIARIGWRILGRARITTSTKHLGLPI